MLAALLAAGSPAWAGTASMTTRSSCAEYSKYQRCDELAVVSYATEAGEANRVSVRRDGDVVRVVDAGATVAAGSGCRGLDAHTAVCPARPEDPYFYVPTLIADLGDGDDALVVQTDLGTGAKIAGGDGRDALTGSPDDDLLDGGTGDDALDGAGGLADRVVYGARTAAVRVDLAAGNGGEAGETDQLVSLEFASGGSGADLLIGTAAENELRGGDGDDRIDGRGGDDDLDGGLGDDLVDGGAGEDRLEGDPSFLPFDMEEVPFGADVLRGGRGDDELSDHGGGDDLAGGSGDDELSGGGDDPARLSGGAGADELAGGYGPDRVLGGPGRDRIDARAGADRVSAGPGRDTIRAKDGSADRVDCGSARDRVVRADRRDRLRGCERRP
ncbi:MAG: hypothetical protein M3P50_06430 [Actinomycetota bacterium]|nr:hypothetical protein [Actinomycetota bacterium]